jgi:hypothetical protein
MPDPFIATSSDPIVTVSFQFGNPVSGQPMDVNYQIYKVNVANLPGGSTWSPSNLTYSRVPQQDSILDRTFETLPVGTLGCDVKLKFAPEANPGLYALVATNDSNHIQAWHFPNVMFIQVDNI